MWGSSSCPFPVCEASRDLETDELTTPRTASPTHLLPAISTAQPCSFTSGLVADGCVI